MEKVHAYCEICGSASVKVKDVMTYNKSFIDRLFGRNKPERVYPEGNFLRWDFVGKTIECLNCGHLEFWEIDPLVW